MLNDGRDSSYTHLGGTRHSSAWLEKQQSGSRRSKIFVCPSPASVAFVVQRSGSVTGGEPWPFAKGFVVFQVCVLGGLIDSSYSRSSSVHSLVSWHSSASVSASVYRSPTRTGPARAEIPTELQGTTPITLCSRTIQTTQALSRGTTGSNNPSMGWLIRPTASCILNVVPHCRRLSPMFSSCLSLPR